MSEKRDGFNNHVIRMADGLRRMADEIEREASRNDLVDDSAQEIINTCTQGFTNLRLGLLVRWTARVMREESKRSAGKQNRAG